MLSPEEVSRLINAAGTLFRRTLLMTLYSTGMRRSELAHLKVGDVETYSVTAYVLFLNGIVDERQELMESGSPEPIFQQSKAEWSGK